MKRVYVETNFIVDLLRPLQRPGAKRLYDRHGRDITLVIPWCSLKEASRTMLNIISQDLAFVDNAGRFLGRLHTRDAEAAGRLRGPVNELLDIARQAAHEDRAQYRRYIDDLAQYETAGLTYLDHFEVP